MQSLVLLIWLAVCAAQDARHSVVSLVAGVLVDVTRQRRQHLDFLPAQLAHLGQQAADFAQVLLLALGHLVLREADHFDVVGAGGCSGLAGGGIGDDGSGEAGILGRQCGDGQVGAMFARAARPGAYANGLTGARLQAEGRAGGGTVISLTWSAKDTRAVA